MRTSGRLVQIKLCVALNSLSIFKCSQTMQNAELFALTYGSLVVQLVQDYEDYNTVNSQLEKMGYNIGCRLIEDFLARSNLGRCNDFREVGEIVAKVRMSNIRCYQVHCTTFIPSHSFPPLGWLQSVSEYHTKYYPFICYRETKFFHHTRPSLFHTHLGREPLCGICRTSR